MVQLCHEVYGTAANSSFNFMDNLNATTIGELVLFGKPTAIEDGLKREVSLQSMSKPLFTLSDPSTSVRSRKRVVGLDVARGLAILGMIGVHVLDPGPFPGSSVIPGNWDQAFAGRPQMLFAILAGVSLALMTGGEVPSRGVELVQWRLRIVVRGLLLFALGGVLVGFPNTNIGVILEYLGVAMILTIPFLTARPKRLAWVIFLGFVVSMFGVAVAQNLYYRQELGNSTTISRLFVYGQYPSLRWTAFMLVGVLIGRLAISERKTQWILLLCALVTWSAAFVLDWMMLRWWGERGVPLSSEIDRFDVSRVVLSSGSVRTLLEYAENAGVAVAVLSVCLMLPRNLRYYYAPLAAAGTLSLSIYTFHVISMNWIWPRIRLENQYQVYLATIVIVLLLSLVWRTTFGQGPVERVVRSISDRAARIT